MHKLEQELQDLIKVDGSIFNFIENSSLDGIWYWDLENPENEWMSNKFWETLGYDPKTKKHLASEWQDIINQDDLAIAFTNFQQHCENPNHPYDQVVRYTHAKGHTVWIRCRGIAVRDKNNTPIRMLGAHTNITDIMEKSAAYAEQAKAFEKAQQVANIGTWEFDVVHNNLYWSEQTKRIHEVEFSFQITLEIGINFYLEGQSRNKISKAVEQCIEHGHPFDIVAQIRTGKSNIKWVRAIGEAQFVNGTCNKIFGVFQDINTQVQQQQAIAEKSELLQVTLKSIGDGVITTDNNSLVTWLNPVAEQMTGWMLSEAKHQPLCRVFNIINETTRASVENPIDLAIKNGLIVGLSNHTLLISKNGDEYGVVDSAAPIRNDSGNVVGGVLVFHDVTEQKNLSREMDFRAKHDALTGLFNRGEFEIVIEQKLRQTKESEHCHAMLYVDLDNFKLINDSAGHTSGDEALIKIAKELKKNLRKIDVLARIGGDEFGIVLDDCDLDKAKTIADKICSSIKELFFVFDEKVFRVGTSIGLVPLDDRWSTSKELMQAADAACYAAKSEGKNRVHCWQETDISIERRHKEIMWSSRIEKALLNDEFELFAQRIFDRSLQEQPIRAEILLRISNNDGGYISPDVFIPAAERYFLAAKLDEYVIKKVINELTKANDLSHISSININISGQSVSDRVFHDNIVKNLRILPLEIRQLLCFEITETATIRSIADAMHFIDKLRTLKVKVALDDFGSGSSSFGYLKNLNVQQLKIDGKFVRDILDDSMDLIAVTSFIKIANHLGLETVAEFVESKEVLDKVFELGIDSVQGFYLHKPEHFLKVLKN